MFFTIAAYCIDAKLNFDDNAYFRQKEIFAMEEASGSEAVKFSLIICISAMATMIATFE